MMSLVKPITTFFLIGILLILSSCSKGDKPIKADLVIADVSVVDVMNGGLLQNQDVFISADSIHSIVSSNSIVLPDSVTVVDGKGRYLIPGLWDMHTHSSRANQSQTQFRLMLSNGITGFRDMWGSISDGNQAMADVKAGNLPGPPRAVVSGNLIDGARPLWRGSLSAATPKRGVQLVDSLHQAGAPFVKIYFGLTLDTYDAIAARCKELDIPFAGHVPSSIPILYTSQSGQKSIEHMTSVVLGCSTEEQELLDKLGEVNRSGDMKMMVNYYVAEMPKRMLASHDEEKKKQLFESFVKNQTWQVPTLVSLRGKAYMNEYKEKGDDRVRYYNPPRRWLGDGPFGFGMTDENWALTQAQYEKEEDIAGEMFKAGVPILAGTDAGTPWTFPGFAIHEELELFVKAGLSPLEALQTATINPAKFFDRTEELGTIQAGKLADLVLLTANPLEDISNTKKIEAVVADGRLYTRIDLDNLLKEVEQLVKDESND